MINPSTYNVDYIKLARWLLITRLRQVNQLAWVRAFIVQINIVYTAFTMFRKQKLYELSITGQICRLETMLNYRWDSTLRRIYIDDGVEKDALYIYTDAELKPVHIYTDAENNPVFLYTDLETQEDGIDFIVYVPISLVFDTAEMRSRIKRKCIPGMQFVIQTF